MAAELDPPISFRQAAIEVFGPSDVRNNSRKLKRIIRTRERRTGKKIAIRDSSGGMRWVTMSSIRKYLPELLSSRVDNLAVRIRVEMHALHERLTAVEERLEKGRK